MTVTPVPQSGNPSISKPARPARQARVAAQAGSTAAQVPAPVADLVAAGERRISLICTDVDGTLMNSQNQLTPGVEQALNAAHEAGVPVVLATGKAMGPWVADVLPRLRSRLPQVYLQGLLINCPDEGVLFRRPLDVSVVREAITFAQQHGLTLTAYVGADRILCEETNEHTDRLVFYREPTPEAVGPLEPFLGQVDVMKLILLTTHEHILEARPAAEQLFAGKASLTMALPGMLEILPLGASKGEGVSWLLNHLGVAPGDVMALGDGENDVEMLGLVGLGVAVGNAGSKARAAADVVVGSNDEDGVAEAVRKFVLQPRGLA
ncbi:hypothetical protein N2152v2_000570 [Parachlorella kessleri]